MSSDRALRGGRVAWLTAALALACPAAAGAQEYVAPDPGGSEAVHVPIPPPGGKLYGMSDVFVDYAIHQSPARWAYYSDVVGSNVIKTSLEWWRAERNRAEWTDPPESERWNEARFDKWREVYDELLARGIRPIFMLTSAPCWARDANFCGAWDHASGRFINEGLRVPPAPGFEEQWGDFVHKVAMEFPQAMIQVWNEPNLATWWADGNPNAASDPVRYTEILEVAYDAVQRAEDDLELQTGAPVQIPVFGPGTINTHRTNKRRMAIGEWLRAAYAAPDPLHHYADGLSIHVFPHANDYDPRGETFGANTLLAETFEQVRAAREAAGDNRPIYVLETGIAAGAEYGFKHSQGIRAFMLRALYRRLMTMPDVRAVIFHRILEPKFHNPDPWEMALAWMRYSPPADPSNPQEQAPGWPEPKFAYCLFNGIAGKTDPGLFYRPCMDVRIKKGPKGVVNNRRPIFRFNVKSEYFVHHYECRVDAHEFTTCATPPDGLASGEFRTRRLTDGEHTVSIRAVDYAGNAGDARARTFTVDTVPATRITDVTIRARRDKAIFSFRARGGTLPVTFGCRLDDGRFRSCESPAVFRNLREGRHEFHVRARDADGVRERTPASESFRIR